MKPSAKKKRKPKATAQDRRANVLDALELVVELLELNLSTTYYSECDVGFESHFCPRSCGRYYECKEGTERARMNEILLERLRKEFL